MDSPWLHVHTAHKLSQLQQRTARLTSQLTVGKWLSIRNLLLEAFLMDTGREKEARLKVYTPAVTYIKVRNERWGWGGGRALKGRHVEDCIFSSSVLLQAAGWGVAEKQSFKASASLVTPWTPLLRGNVSLENSKLSHALHVTSTCGKQNLSLSAALNSVDKVSCDTPSV